MANSCVNEWSSSPSITKLLFIVEYQITLPSMTFSTLNENHETNINNWENCMCVCVCEFGWGDRKIGKKENAIQWSRLSWSSWSAGNPWFISSQLTIAMEFVSFLVLFLFSHYPLLICLNGWIELTNPFQYVNVYSMLKIHCESICEAFVFPFDPFIAAKAFEE